MEHIGIDVHEVESQIRILTESGEIVERRIRTERERFAAVLGGRAPAKIVSEASTETESVGRCLEKLGHEVGGRPELRRDVRDAEPQGEDGSARRVRADENQVHDARSCSTPWHAPHDGHRAYPMVGITDRAFRGFNRRERVLANDSQVCSSLEQDDSLPRTGLGTRRAA